MGRSVTWPTSLCKSPVARSVSCYHPLPSAPSKPVLTFYSIGYRCAQHLPLQTPAKTHELKIWYISHAFWKGGWNWTSGHQNPHTTISQALANTTMKGFYAGLVGHRDGICTKRPQSTCLLRLVAASLFTSSGFFWSDTINMNCNNYEVTVQVVGAWSYVWSGVPLQSCSPTPTKFVHGAFADHSRLQECLRNAKCHKAVLGFFLPPSG